MKNVDERFKQTMRIGSVIFSLFLQFLFLTAGFPQRAQAAPGDLDISFGTGGKVMTDFGGGGVSSVAIQADGKIVAAGMAVNGINSDFALARYNPDGSLDPSFGTGGKVITDFASGSDFASSVAIQADGKIVAAGSTRHDNWDFALARYNPDGSLDPGFGTGGKVMTNFDSSYDFYDSAHSVAIQTDGKIVAAGSTWKSLNSNFALARYNPDGSLDLGFGTGGKVMTDFTSGDSANSVAIQADGKIVAAGSAQNGTNDAAFVLVRYNTDGNLDTSFGTGGKVMTDFPSSSVVAYSVAIQADGKIVAAGFAVNGTNYDFALARYNPDGSLDTSFGTGGQVMTDFTSGSDAALSVAIQADGKIVAAGSARNGTNDNDFALARYNPDGSLDQSFGTGGKVMTDFGGDGSVGSVAIQADGKIVAAGGAVYDFALVRYLAAPAGDTPAGNNVTVQPVDPTTNTSPVTIVFDNVTSSGTTSVTTSGTGTPPPNGFKLGNPPVYYSIETTAGYSGPIHVCINYSGISFGSEKDIKLFHWSSITNSWQNITDPGYPDTKNHILCGTATSLSPFGIFEPSYSFTGFLPPVDNPQVLNAVKAGSAVPVKFSLGSYQGLDIMAAGSPGSATMSCGNAAIVDDLTDTVTAGSSSLTYDAASDQYIYVWKTDKAWAGTCRLLRVMLKDGIPHEANFKFNK